MSVASSRASRRSRASTNDQLPHWSEVSSKPVRAQPSAHVAAVLRDLVVWAADLALRYTRGCPEDRDAIERVRDYTCAWLAGAPCSEIALEDVLTTTAALMAGIDRRVGGTVPDDDERHAIGAPVCA
jgi:hypothetical protein